MIRQRPWARWGAVAAILAGAANLVGADEPAAARFVIGVLLPPQDATASSLRQGALCALDEVNRASGGGLSLVFRGRLDQWGADGAEAARLVTEDGAGALVAPPGGAASHLALQVAGRTAVPVVSLCPDTSVTRAGIPWMVRIMPRSGDEARAILGHELRTSDGRQRHWSAVVPAGRAGREAARDLAEAARTVGCSLQPPFEWIGGTNGLEALVDQALATRPDGILLWVESSGAARLAKSLRGAGYQGVLGGPGWLRSPEFAAAAGTAAEGVVAPELERDAAALETFARFELAYQACFHSDPDNVAVFAHDAVLLLADLLRGQSGGAGAGGFPLTRAVVGASGRLEFDRDGNRVGALRVLTCRAAAWVPAGGPSVHLSGLTR